MVSWIVADAKSKCLENLFYGPLSLASAVLERHWSKGVEAVGCEGRGARSEGSKGLAVLFSTGHVAAAC